MNQKHSLRIAIIGCGAVARKFHLPSMTKMNITPTAFIDNNIKNATAFSQDYPNAFFSDQIENLLQLFDAAIVATPNNSHYSIVLKLLESGKHVLVEKPLTVKSKETEHIIEVATRKNLVLQPAMVRRYWHVSTGIKGLLENKRLGDIKKIEMQEGNIFKWPVKSSAIFDKQLSGGGVLMDAGTHVVDLLMWMTNSSKYDFTYTDDNKGGVETECHLQLTLYPGKIPANIQLSRIRTLRNTYRITGTKGWIEWIPFANSKIKTSDSTIKNELYGTRSKKDFLDQSFADLFEEQLRDWIDSVQHLSKPKISAASVLPSVLLIENCYAHRTQLNYPWENV